MSQSSVLIQHLPNRTRAKALKNCALFVAQIAETKHNIKGYSLERKLALRIPVASAFSFAKSPEGMLYWIRKSGQCNEPIGKNESLLLRLKDLSRKRTN